MDNPKHPAPSGYTDYRLCKLFGCLPSELDAEDAETIGNYSAFYSAELRHEKIERDKSSGKTPPVKGGKKQ